MVLIGENMKWIGVALLGEEEKGANLFSCTKEEAKGERREGSRVMKECGSLISENMTRKGVVVLGEKGKQLTCSTSIVLGTTFHHSIFVALSVGTSVEEKILKTF